MLVDIFYYHKRFTNLDHGEFMNIPLMLTTSFLYLVAFLYFVALSFAAISL